MVLFDDFPGAADVAPGKSANKYSRIKMTEAQTPGSKLRAAVAANNPLQVVGAVNAYNAIMAQKSGHQALYLSGGGVAACSLGKPDLGISTLADVLEDARVVRSGFERPQRIHLPVVKVQHLTGVYLTNVLRFDEV